MHAACRARARSSGKVTREEQREERRHSRNASSAQMSVQNLIINLISVRWPAETAALCCRGLNPSRATQKRTGITQR